MQVKIRSSGCGGRILDVEFVHNTVWGIRWMFPRENYYQNDMMWFLRHHCFSSNPINKMAVPRPPRGKINRNGISIYTFISPQDMLEICLELQRLFQESSWLLFCKLFIRNGLLLSCEMLFVEMNSTERTGCNITWNFMIYKRTRRCYDEAVTSGMQECS
jgi:hypothetical protein